MVKKNYVRIKMKTRSKEINQQSTFALKAMPEELTTKMSWPHSKGKFVVLVIIIWMN